MNSPRGRELGHCNLQVPKNALIPTKLSTTGHNLPLPTHSTDCDSWAALSMQLHRIDGTSSAPRPLPDERQSQRQYSSLQYLSHTQAAYLGRAHWLGSADQGIVDSE